MSRIVFIRPGQTDYDQRGRITGTLDIPLNEVGHEQVRRIADDVRNHAIEQVFCSPCRAAVETAESLGMYWAVRTKIVKSLANLNHGLWQGKLIDEVRLKQPKVYRIWQEHPETVCPPEGESLASSRLRVRAVLQKLARKYRDVAIAVVLPEPIHSIAVADLRGTELGDLWKLGRMCGTYDVVECGRQSTVSMA
jgi:probable phosphoglycerate mutase